MSKVPTDATHNPTSSWQVASPSLMHRPAQAPRNQCVAFARDCMDAQTRFLRILAANVLHISQIACKHSVQVHLGTDGCSPIYSSACLPCIRRQRVLGIGVGHAAFFWPPPQPLDHQDNWMRSSLCRQQGWLTVQPLQANRINIIHQVMSWPPACWALLLNRRSSFMRYSVYSDKARVAPCRTLWPAQLQAPPSEAFPGGFSTSQASSPAS